MLELMCIAFSLLLLATMVVLQNQPTPAEVMQKQSEEMRARTAQAAAQAAAQAQEERRQQEIIWQAAAARRAEQAREDEERARERARQIAHNEALRWRVAHPTENFYRWLRG